MSKYRNKLIARACDYFFGNVVKQALSWRITKDFADFRMQLDLSDPFQRLLFRGEEYERHVLQITRQLIAPDHVVFDIGANVGYFTLAFANMVGPNGLVVAIEPEPSNYERLVYNVLLNKLRNVIYYQSAMGHTDGFVHLAVSPDNSGWHQMEFVGTLPKTSGLVRVPVQTVDTIVDIEQLRAVHFIKIDVQGSEYEVLRGMKSTLYQHRPVLLIEVLPRDTGQAKVQQLFRLLHELNYEMQLLSHDGNLVFFHEEQLESERVYTLICRSIDH